MRNLTVLLGLVLVVSIGCGKKDENGARAPGEPGVGAKPGPLIGKWQFEGSQIFQSYNSKGRIKMDLPEGTHCLGSYKVSDARMEVTYDPEQPNCVSGAMGFTLKDDGTTLDFMGAVYKRVDTTDDPSF